MIKYGISILSTIPVRIDSNDKSEMTSQILFGEHFKILKEKVNIIVNTKIIFFIFFPNYLI